MAQISTPTSLTSEGWTGTAASLTEETDSTYIESPVEPVPSQTFLCGMGGVTDPGVDTGHQIVVRAAVEPASGYGATLTLTVENTDDGSVVATRDVDVTATFAETTLELTEAEAALVHSYQGLRIRGAVQPYATVYFVWADQSADSYILQVGTASGWSDVYNTNVGAVLTASVDLDCGATYYARVIPVVDDVAGTPGTEQTVTV